MGGQTVARNRMRGHNNTLADHLTDNRPVQADHLTDLCKLITIILQAG